jgi:hypothetical protein
MSTERYDDVYKKALGLSPDEQEQLIRQLARRAADKKNGDGKTLGQCMEARGLRGIAHGPTDLSTNPKHLEGFGDNGH